MIEPLLNPREIRMVWMRGASAVALCLLLFVVAAAASEKGNVMSDHATGTFEVKITPEAAQSVAPPFGRMTIDKTLHGDLEGTSVGLMLTAGDRTTGDAGYVAMEKVTGTLKGLKGTFVLMHQATMAGGAIKLAVDVVPGSGTGALKGLAGAMTIHQTAGQHSYDFDYTLPK